MAYEAKILADSVNSWGNRLTTFEVTVPRIILAEWNTHKMFSRNSASSRAIPVEKMIKRVMEDPYIPEEFGSNQRGMQAGEALDAIASAACEKEWLLARDSAVRHARYLLNKGVHKQLTNRLLEPFMWHTIINTATDYSNFFHLRNNAMAHPGIAKPARMMQELYESVKPVELSSTTNHLPLIDAEDILDGTRQYGAEGLESVLEKVSAARCARVSYLTHDGKRDMGKDLELHDRLLSGGHMSPFEHVARPMNSEEHAQYCRWWVTFKNGKVLPLQRVMDYPEETISPGDVLFDSEVVSARKVAYCGNLDGWIQYRKTIPREEDIMAKAVHETAGS